MEKCGIFPRFFLQNMTSRQSVNTKIGKRTHLILIFAHNTVLPGHQSRLKNLIKAHSFVERTRFREVAESSVLDRLAKSRGLGRFLVENGEVLNTSKKNVVTNRDYNTRVCTL